MISFRRVFALVSLGSVLLFGSAARADELEKAFDAEIGIPATVVTTTTSERTAAPRRDPGSVGALSDHRVVRRVRLPNSDAERSTVTTVTTHFHRHHGRRHASR